MKELTYLLLLVVIYFVYMNIVRKRLFLVKVKSKQSDNGGSFLVRNLKDKQEASNILARLSKDLQAICDACEDKMSDETKDRVEAIQRLGKKFKQ